MQGKKLVFVLFLLASGVFVQAQSLDFYLKKGLGNSPLLKDFKNKLLAGRLDSLLVRASYKPMVNQVSQVMYAPSSNNFGYDEAITNGGNYSAVLSVVQPLFNKKIRKNQLRDISLSGQSIENQLQFTESDLKQGITSQYLTAYTNLRQVQFGREILSLLKKEQELLKPLVDKGIYAQTDAMTLEVSVTAQKIAVQQALMQYRNNVAILDFICGINDTSSVTLQKPELTMTNRFDINNTPSMLKFKIDSMKTGNAKKTIGLNYRPKLNVVADAGFMAILPENIRHNFGTSLGLNFTLPVYDGKQRKLQQEKLQFDEDSRLEYQTFYTLQYKQQVNQLVNQLKLNGELIANIRSQLAQQEKIIELYKAEIEKGLVRFLDFLNIINSYAQSKSNLTTAEMDRLQIINQMNYLK